VILAVVLVVGTGVLVPAFSVVAAYFFFRDGPILVADKTVRSPASLDPNEAARAVGSWG
jgi:hypothetical protein